jgi:uncharacterized protein (TIGR03435 family)
VRRAFGLEPYAMSGPDWLEEIRFDIQATIPAGRRRDDVPAMLQALLIQRFGMATHRESRDVPAFVLVAGDKGHRMRESQPESDQPSGGAGEKASGATASGASAGPRKPATMTMKTENNGTMTFRAGPDGTIEGFTPKMTMTELARSLTGMLQRPVFDRTGLTAPYEVTLSVAMTEVARMVSLGPAGAAMPSAVGPASAASEPGGMNSVVGRSRSSG